MSLPLTRFGNGKKPENQLEKPLSRFNAEAVEAVEAVEAQQSPLILTNPEAKPDEPSSTDLAAFFVSRRRKSPRRTLGPTLKPIPQAPNTDPLGGLPRTSVIGVRAEMKITQTIQSNIRSDEDRYANLFKLLAQ